MQSRFTLGLLTILVAFASPAARGGIPLVNETDLAEAGMVSYWRADLPLAAGDTVHEGYLVDDALYVITDSGTVFALTAAEGLIRWAEKVTEPDYTIYRPTHALQKDGAGPVVIPTTAVIYVYDRFSGDRIQGFTPDFPISGSAVAVGTNLFTGSSDARFYSLLRWNPATCRPMKLWEVATGGPITASPIYYGGGLLLFASHDGSVYSCFSRDKELNWTYKVGGSIFGDMAIDDQSVFVASSNRSLYKLDLRTGQFQWRFRMPRPLYEGPVVTAQTVYQYCSSNGIIAIETSDGREKWRIEDAVALSAHTPNGDVLFTSDRKLLLVDHQTGKIKQKMGTSGVIGTVRNVEGSAVFVLGKSGAVECLQLDDVPYLQRQQVNAARARLHKAPKAEKLSEGIPASKQASKPTDPFRSPRDGRQN